MSDFWIGIIIGSLLFGAPVFSMLIVSKGHVRFFDDRKWRLEPIDKWSEK